MIRSSYPETWSYETAGVGGYRLLRFEGGGSVNETPGPTSRSVLSESLIEQWVYSGGKGSLLKIVVLRSGRIESIENGPRQ